MANFGQLLSRNCPFGPQKDFLGNVTWRKNRLYKYMLLELYQAHKEDLKSMHKHNG